MQDWMKHKMESRLPGEILITSDRQMTPPLWQKVKPDPVALVRASENTDKTPCVLDFPGQAVQPGSGDPH